MQHACHACARDLSRVRAATEPRYGWALVTCPDCAERVVRRPDPLLAGWRQARRTARTLVLIAVQCAVFALTTLAGWGLVGQVSKVAAEAHEANPLAVLLTRPHELRPDDRGPDLLIAATTLALLGLLAGGWVGSTLRHLRMPVAIPAWAGAATLIALVPAIEHALWRLVKPGGAPWGSAAHLDRLGATVTAGSIYAAFMLLGLVFAPSLRQAWHGHARAARARMRRRRRRLREDR